MALERELPDDILADVLHRLPPRSLAVCRCVRRAWRDVVDARRLLRADLLPLAVRGIFIEYCVLPDAVFFSRPSTGPEISGSRLDFVSSEGGYVLDHCNGLLLYDDDDYDEPHYYVVNPATRQWARLPPPVAGAAAAAHLVFDPTMSPHYQVFLAPLPVRAYEIDLKVLQSQWPSSSYTLQVFSSSTGHWEEQLYLPEEAGTGLHVPERYVTQTIANMERWSLPSLRHNSVYWRGAIYIPWQHNFVMRITLSSTKYKIVELPTDFESKYHPTFSLGRSKFGVYCALTHDWRGLWIWLLDESYDEMQWILKHRVDLKTFARKLYARKDYEQEPEGPWILQNINDPEYLYGNDKEAAAEEKYEWNSDNDNILDTEDMVEGNYSGYIGLLGFHPYKEVVFLDVSLRRGVAYHWNTSKFQDLGNLFPKDYGKIAGHVAEIDKSFIYTPCWMEDFPETKWDTPIEN